MNENIFRAYDIRGNAEQDLTPDVLVKIGFVLGNKVKDSGSDAIYVGHDSRLSCQRIFSDLCVGEVLRALRASHGTSTTSTAPPNKQKN